MPSRTPDSIASIRLVAAFCLLYTAVLGIACYLKFATFQYSDFDLSVHAQSLHNMLRGSIDCSILGTPYPGNHMALILILLAPLYALFSSPLTLLLAQTIILAAGAIVLFIYAQAHLPRPYPAIIAALYLLYPPLIYMNLYEFHPVALATTFLLFALLAYDRKMPRAYALALLLAMACQENISLIVVMLGLKALVDRRRAPWAALPLLGGAAWFAACIFWIMPALNPGTVGFSSIYSDLGTPPPESFSEVILAIIRNPIFAVGYALTPAKLLYLGSLTLPLGLMSLLSPASLLPTIPILAQRLLSNRGSESTILYHYQAELIPFIFVAAVHGLARIGTLKRIDIQRVVVAIMAGLTILAVDVTNVPTAIMRTAQEAETGKHLTALRRQLLLRVGPEARAAATFRYLPHLSGRSHLHSLHHIYTGYYTLSDVPYPIPRDIDVILIDSDDPLTFGKNAFFTKGGHTNIQNLLHLNQMVQVARIETVHAFVREELLGATAPSGAAQDAGPAE